MGKMDYLVTEADTSVLKNLAEMGEHLQELQLKMLKCEAAYEQAKGEFLHYQNSVLPLALYNANVTSVGLANGNSIKAVTKYHCSIAKNADKKKLADWLIEHGGDYLINKQAVVSGEVIKELKAKQIPYIEQDDMNTNSIKKFLKELLGEGTGEAKIDITDIPKDFHFFREQSVELVVNN